MNNSSGLVHIKGPRRRLNQLFNNKWFYLIRNKESLTLNYTRVRAWKQTHTITIHNGKLLIDDLNNQVSEYVITNIEEFKNWLMEIEYKR